MSYSDIDKINNSIEKMFDIKDSYKKVARLEGLHDVNNAWLDIDEWTGQEDVINAFRGSSRNRVNSPAHYTRGKQEAIDIIEDAIQDAPSVTEGMLQAQVLKYILRVWLKDNPTEDLKKAQWYLSRLIDKQEQE